MSMYENYTLERYLISTKIENAGLCILAPWLPKLFTSLDYLNEERADFKDVFSRCRAIVLLQYIISPTDRNYSRHQLLFNRILMALPSDIKIPEDIELTEIEKDIADEMLVEIKDSWPRMNHTNIPRFIDCFIARIGHMDEQDDKWVLIIKNKCHDLMLESLPWSYKEINFPWMKKPVEVSWHDKEI